MEPKGTVASQDDCAINKTDQCDRPTKEANKEDDEWKRKAESGEPSKEWKPVLSRVENVKPSNIFSYNFRARRNIKLVISFKTISGWVKNAAEDGSLVCHSHLQRKSENSGR
jgi:hypothetical protein